MGVAKRPRERSPTRNPVRLRFATFLTPPLKQPTPLLFLKQGDKWNFSLMARRLAEAGAVVAVMEYTLYPEAEADQQAAEVSTALDWVVAHAGDFGAGAGSNLTVVGAMNPT